MSFRRNLIFCFLNYLNNFFYLFGCNAKKKVTCAPLPNRRHQPVSYSSCGFSKSPIGQWHPVYQCRSLCRNVQIGAMLHRYYSADWWQPLQSHGNSASYRPSGLIIATLCVFQPHRASKITKKLYEFKLQMIFFKCELILSSTNLFTFWRDSIEFIDEYNSRRIFLSLLECLP